MGRGGGRRRWHSSGDRIEMTFAALMIALMLAEQTAPGSRAGVVRPDSKCSDWTQQRNPMPGSSAVNFGYVMRVWLVGFIDGVGVKDRKVAGADPVFVARRLDDYCKANPSQELIEAAAVVVKRLPKR